MLARILFNLTFIATVAVGIFSALKWGILYAAPAAFGTFVVGLAAAFVIGLIKGASSIAE